MNKIDPFKAVDDQNEQALHTFLKAGGNPNMENDLGFRLILHAINRCFIKGTLLLLLYQEEDQAHYNISQLGTCVSFKNFKTLDFLHALLLLGADPNYTWAAYPYSPLIQAVKHCRFDEVSMLLEFGANPSLRVNGKLPMDAVSSSRDIDSLFIAALLKYWQDIDSELGGEDSQNVTNSVENENDEDIINQIDQQMFDLKRRKLELQIKNQSKKEKEVIKEIAEIKDRLIETRKQITKLQESFDTDYAVLNAKLDVARQCRNSVLTLKKQTLLLSNSDKVNNNVDNEERDLECPICFEVPLPGSPIYQCEEGHLYCGKCKDKPNMDNCPQCQKPIKSKNIRNRAVENLIKRKYPF